MLSMISRKNSLLYEFVGRTSRPRAEGSAIVRELERGEIAYRPRTACRRGQPLAGIKLNLEMLDDCRAELPPRGREALARLQTLAEQALDQVRAVSHSLHPPEWQDLTTEEAFMAYRFKRYVDTYCGAIGYGTTPCRTASYDKSRYLSLHPGVHFQHHPAFRRHSLHVFAGGPRLDT